MQEVFKSVFHRDYQETHKVRVGIKLMETPQHWVEQLNLSFFSMELYCFRENYFNEYHALDDRMPVYQEIEVLKETLKGKFFFIK